MAVQGSTRSSLTDRLDFIGLDGEGRARLKALKPVIAKAIGPALAVFYEKVKAIPETRKFFADEAQMSDAGGRQEKHWNIIADAEYGGAYENAVRSTGRAHARLGLEPRLYIGGYALVTEQLIKAVVTEWPRRFGLSKGGHDDVAASLASLVKAVMVEQTMAAVHSLRSQVAGLVRTVSRFNAEGQAAAAAPRSAAAPKRPALAPKRTGFAVQGNTALAAGDADGWEEF